MNTIAKRIILLSIGLVVALAITASLGGFKSGLPAANPAAAKSGGAPSGAPARTDSEAARSQDTAKQAEAQKAQQRVQELQQRLAENPRDPTALAEMVDGLFQAKRYNQAAELLAQALDAGEDNSRLRVGLGLALFYQGMPSLGQKEIKRAIELDPNNAQAHFQYGLLVSHGPRADLEAASVSWETAARLDPDGDIGRRAKEMLGQNAASGK